MCEYCERLNFSYDTYNVYPNTRTTKNTKCCYAIKKINTIRAGYFGNASIHISPFQRLV